MVLVGGGMALAGWSDGRLGRLRVLCTALGLVFAAALAGCGASGERVVTVFATAEPTLAARAVGPVLAARAARPVLYLLTDPVRAHISVAHIEIKGGRGEGFEDVLYLVRVEAAKVGADAVVGIHMSLITEKSESVGDVIKSIRGEKVEIETWQVFVITGTAVRFGDPP